MMRLTERKPRAMGQRNATRSAFSLIELVVAMGILVIMIALAGQVFSISVKSTGEATALIDVNQSLRRLEQTLREDLAGVDPARSMMVIWSQPINAYWTRDQQEIDPTGGDPMVGYVHNPDPERELSDPNDPNAGIDGAAAPPFRLTEPRADILMFFTARRTRSNVYPQVFADQAQVVYGHAELGELNPDESWQSGPNTFPAFAFPLTAAEYHPFPARDWHLGRRTAALVDAPELAVAILADDENLTFPDDPGDMSLVIGEADVIAQEMNTFFFNQDVLNTTTAIDPLNIPLPNISWFARPQFDETPPAVLASRLSSYLLPNCASFKVEWTISGSNGVPAAGTILWHDPQDAAAFPIGNLNYDTYMDSGNAATDNEIVRRFSNRPAAQVALDQDLLRPGAPIWYARDPRPGASVTANDPLWPTALRITIDVFDDAGRFERPIRHVMILPVGGDS